MQLAGQLVLEPGLPAVKPEAVGNRVVVAAADAAVALVEEVVYLEEAAKTLEIGLVVVVSELNLEEGEVLGMELESEH